MKYSLIAFCILLSHLAFPQTPVNLPGNLKENATQIKSKGDQLLISWPVGKKKECELVLNLDNTKPLFSKMGFNEKGKYHEILQNAEPEFLLNVGRRTLKPENGWTIFFDKVPTRPYESYHLKLDKNKVNVTKHGKRTVVTIGEMSAPDFKGAFELTIYNDSPLINLAAVVSTDKDSTAILYDAGLSTSQPFKQLSFAKNNGEFNSINGNETTVTNEKVKHRTIIGSNDFGGIAVFPAPHQYFYPLDEAFNLAFVWHGAGYRDMIERNAIGIRQDPKGDNRFVPWFNAPPKSQQRLNFFCLLGDGTAQELLDEVKLFTHNDVYPELKGHKTMASHFHNEFIMNVVRAGKNDKPEFTQVFKDMGVDIVHLGEFHYTAHPKGPDSLRLEELKALFDLCANASDNEFLLLPGEEPNEFFGGHWMQLFSSPVYWVMDRKDGQQFVSDNPKYGKVYHIKDAAEMTRLLDAEHGLAWTAHPRIKGSTGYPDAYKGEAFFKNDQFMGGAWKAMPADLSSPKLGMRVLNLLDDMNNWGLKKHVIAESDLFTITKENEMYAHMNINYMKLGELPTFDNGWKPVVDAMSTGDFFSTTGEVLIPSFTVNGKSSGETITVKQGEELQVKFNLQWTFPLNFAEIISGDGEKVYRERIDLNGTSAFGADDFSKSIALPGRTWVRLEVWDVAGNGAFTQSIYLKK
ncbi:hypothetical protein [Fulvivirga ligni]|uniref:hypothetical protein n=1 Tax=Fulvivirga ligni TaxID=2904246 RepID=UPI001F38C036|nr:hypothetical protein [Fulvivirga ligni]UII19930.1 hypothetical protein LVD16_18980 [Fulvivirga ligni]